MAAQVGQRVFGAGRFFGIPNASAPTPTEFLLTQNMSLDFKRDIKELHGLEQLPAEVASGMLKVNGKVTMGTHNQRALNSFLIAGTLSTGTLAWVDRESVVVSTLTNSFNVANTPLAVDLGVNYKASGIPLVEVASTTPGSSGLYGVSSTGGYAFNAADAGSTLQVNYLWTNSAAGQQLTMSNANMGKTGNFKAVMAMVFGSDQLTVELYNCMVSDWGIATVLDDFSKPSIGFSCAVDATDTLGVMGFAQVY